jgi:hypothetical protein
VFARSPVWFHISVGISYIKGHTPSPSPGDRTLWTMMRRSIVGWINCLRVRSSEGSGSAPNLRSGAGVTVGKLSDCFGLHAYACRKHRSWVCASPPRSGGSPGVAPVCGSFRGPHIRSPRWSPRSPHRATGHITHRFMGAEGSDFTRYYRGYEMRLVAYCPRM